MKDLYEGQQFDYILSNPPFGKDWSNDREAVETESAKSGSAFSHGLPAVSDGQVLFLAHCASKLRTAGPNGAGGRAAVVSNGSPLFTGGPGSGPDTIRAWLLAETDLVDAIIALPTSIFYGTGIATYVWILDTNKEPRRKGKIQLINGLDAWSPMQKGMGEKRREMSADDRKTILEAYAAFEESEISKIVTAADLGYRDVPVQRQRRLAVKVTDEAVLEAMSHKDADVEHAGLIESLDGPWNALPARIKAESKKRGVRVSVGLIDAIMQAIGVDDETAPPAVNRLGKPVLVEGSKLTERVALSEDVTEHMEREVLPFAPNAVWDESAPARLATRSVHEAVLQANAIAVAGDRRRRVQESCGRWARSSRRCTANEFRQATAVERLHGQR